MGRGVGGGGIGVLVAGGGGGCVGGGLVGGGLVGFGLPPPDFSVGVALEKIIVPAGAGVFVDVAGGV